MCNSSIHRALLALLIVLITTIFLTVLPSTYAVRSEDVDDWCVVDCYWTAPVRRGALATLEVMIKCLSPTPINNVTARLNLTKLYGYEYYVVDTYNGTVVYPRVVTFTFTFRVPDEAKLTTYVLPLEIRYLKNCTSLIWSTELTISIAGEPDLVVIDYRPRTLTKEVENEVTVLIENNGTATARDVAIEVYTADPSVTVTTESVVGRFAVLDQDQVAEVRFSIYPSSRSGDTTSVTIRITYYDTSGRFYMTYTMGFKIAEVPTPELVIYTSKTSLKAGVQEVVDVLVENRGPGTAKNVTIEVITHSPKLTVVGRSKLYVGDIPPEAIASVKLGLYADPNAIGGADVALTVHYTDDLDRSHLETVTLGFVIVRAEAPLIVLEMEPRQVSPGEVQRVYLEVKNVGGDTAHDVVLNLQPTPQLAVLGPTVIDVGTVPPGSSKRIEIGLYVPTERFGVQNLRAIITYRDSRGSTYVNTITLSLISLERGKPYITYAVLNSTLEPNRVNRVVIVVSNVGLGSAYNVTIVLTPAPGSEKYVSLASPGRYFYPVLRENETVTTAFRLFIQPVVYGAVQLYLSILYEDKWGKSYRVLTPVGFEVRGLAEIAVAHVLTIPTPIFDGDRAVRIQVTVTNIGNYPAKNLKLVLRGNVTKPTYAGSDTYTIPYLPVGNTVTVTFVMDISEGYEGLHELHLDVRGSYVINKSIPVPLLVYGKARWSIEIKSPKVLKPGMRGVKLLLVLKNLGKVMCRDVRISLVSPYITGTTTILVGDVGPEESRVVAMEIDVSDAIPIGKNPIEFDIFWTQEGRELSTSKVVNVVVEKAEVKITMFVIIALIAIATILICYVLKRRSIISRVVGGV
ncbi:MAG: hypothetical protein DRJ40_07875 [Thermoprotei archaeon]|nr:MAG: hypothetical protein DRJ40_07875 [Thermoprotei archaeon]